MGLNIFDSPTAIFEERTQLSKPRVKPIKSQTVPFPLHTLGKMVRESHNQKTEKINYDFPMNEFGEFDLT